jgi:hypothetical protein
MVMSVGFDNLKCFGQFCVPFLVTEVTTSPYNNELNRDSDFSGIPCIDPHKIVNILAYSSKYLSETFNVTLPLATLTTHFYCMQCNAYQKYLEVSAFWTRVNALQMWQKAKKSNIRPHNVFATQKDCVPFSTDYFASRIWTCSFSVLRSVLKRLNGTPTCSKHYWHIT